MFNDRPKWCITILQITTEHWIWEFRSLAVIWSCHSHIYLFIVIVISPIHRIQNDVTFEVSAITKGQMTGWKLWNKNLTDVAKKPGFITVFAVFGMRTIKVIKKTFHFNAVNVNTIANGCSKRFLVCHAISPVFKYQFGHCFVSYLPLAQLFNSRPFKTKISICSVICF